jgi:hypothetical protein
VEVAAWLVCSAIEIYPAHTTPFDCSANSANARFSSTEFRLCLLADGRLRMADSPAARVYWYPYDQGRSPGVASAAGDAPLRSDVGWNGVCTTDGHVTLDIDDGQRLLAGHLLPPCSIAGSLTSSTSQGGRFEVNISYIELPGDGNSRRAGTWDELLGLLRQLRMYERRLHVAAAAATGKGVGTESAVDFSSYLPLEAMFAVCSFLSVPDVLSLGACSQVLRHICTDPWLWKQIYGRRFGTHTLLVPLNDDASDAEETQQQHEIEELHEGFDTPVAEAKRMWSGQAWPSLPPYTGDPDNSEDEDDWLGRYKSAITMNSLVQTGLVVNEGLFILDGVCHTCPLEMWP